MLCEVLDEDNVQSVLDRAAGRTEDEVKMIAASLRPRPALPDLLRLLPTPEKGAERTAPAGPNEPVELFAPELRASEPRLARIEPISESLRVLRVTIGQDFFDD